MIWSKLKRSLEALLADAVKEHLQLHLTRYGPGVSSLMNRAWITWDGEEIHTFSTIGQLQAARGIAAQMYENGERKEPPGFYEPSEDLVERLEPTFPSRLRKLYTLPARSSEPGPCSIDAWEKDACA